MTYTFEELLDLAGLARIARAGNDLQTEGNLHEGWRFLSPDELGMIQQFFQGTQFYTFQGQNIIVDRDGFFTSGTDKFYFAINDSLGRIAVVARSLEGLSDFFASQVGIRNDDLSEKIDGFAPAVSALQAYVSIQGTLGMDLQVIATGHSLGGAIAAELVNEVDFIHSGVGFGAPGLTSESGTFLNITRDSDWVGSIYSAVLGRYYEDTYLTIDVGTDRGTENYLVFRDNNYISPEQVSGNADLDPLADGFAGDTHRIENYIFELQLLGQSDAFRSQSASIYGEIEFGRRSERELSRSEGDGPNFFGTFNNDNIDGSSLAIDQRIEGWAGDDTIIGGSGNDTLSGGQRNDTITGGGGNDTIYGGDGDLDVAVFENAVDDYELVDGSPSNFRIRALSGNEGTDTLIGVERIQFGGGDEISTADFFALKTNAGGGSGGGNEPPPQDDHSDSRAEATNVTLLNGTYTDGDIEVAGDEDFFSFSTRDGSLYGVTVLPGDASLDVDIRIYDDLGRLVADNINSTGSSSAFSTFTSDGGTYFVEVSGEGGSTGEYGIGIYDVTDGSGGNDPGSQPAPNDQPDAPGSGNATHEGDNGDDEFIFSSSDSRDLFVKLFDGDDLARTGRGDDIVLGGDDDDVIETRDGDDIISGGEGRDEIEGGDDDDGIAGGDDDDTIDGGEGEDIIAGERGDDRIDGGPDDDVLDGGDGEDRVDGEDGEDGILGGEGDDRLSGGRGDDVIYGGVDDDDIFGEDGDDSLDGESGEDDIRGEDGNDFLDGGEGEDELDGGDGNDTIMGGSDNDLIEPGAGDDTIDGEGGDDTLSYNNFDEGATIDLNSGRAFGSEIGFDTFQSIIHLHGTHGDDVILGDGQSSKIDGDQGADTITGGGGNDEIDGGSGTDVAVYSGNRSDYTITVSTNTQFDFQIVDNRPGSPDGTDLIDSISFLQFADVRIRDDDGLSAAPTASNDSFTVPFEEVAVLDVLENDIDPDGNELTITRIVEQPSSGLVYIVNGKVVFEPGDDFLGDDDEEVSFTYEITDGLGWTSEATATVLVEARASDVSATNLSFVQRSDGSGLFDATFTISNQGPDLTEGITVALRLSSDNEIGSSDDLLGTVTTNSLVSGESAQLTLNGVDLEPFQNLDGFVPGDYFVAVEADSEDELSESNEENNVSNLVSISLELLDLNTILGTFAAETLDGTSGADEIFGFNRNDVLNGLGGNDVLTGGFGADTLNGGEGDDTLIGEAGVDTLNGGAGLDSLTGGMGRDLFVLDANGTAADADVITDFAANEDSIDITGASGQNFAFTQAGSDVEISADGVLLATVQNAIASEVEAKTTYDGAELPPTPGLNTILGTFAAETLDGTSGADEIFGFNRNDVLNGLGGNDVLTGGFGADTLNGGEGDDTLIGEAGVDTLNGGAGLDSLTGGMGRDLFVLDANGTAADADVITDFAANEDSIDITGASGQNFAFTQAGSDVEISADGVLLATVQNAIASEVEAKTTYVSETAATQSVNLSSTQVDRVLEGYAWDESRFEFQPVDRPIGLDGNIRNKEVSPQATTFDQVTKTVHWHLAEENSLEIGSISWPESFGHDADILI